MTTTAQLIGQSKGIVDLNAAINKVGKSNAIILIRGETGTGKELVARKLHRVYQDHVGEGPLPLVPVNCAAITGTLAEAELFGHTKGSFTGAEKDTEGYFEATGEGTLFLDEIGSMPLDLQSKFLRVLQEKEFTKIGSRKTIGFKGRIIASCNEDLELLIKKGKFREDLYYRINVISLNVPALRQRVDDIPYFINYFSKKNNFNLQFSKGALEMLMMYDWPGNVRQLENLLTGYVTLEKTDEIMLYDLPEYITDMEVKEKKETYSNNFREAVDQFSKKFILNKLEETRWNCTQAAFILGMHRNTLMNKMNSLGIVGPREAFESVDRI